MIDQYMVVPQSDWSMSALLFLSVLPFIKAHGDEEETEDPNENSRMVVHGILMFLAWQLFTPLIYQYIRLM
jgi:hypothetical protein